MEQRNTIVNMKGEQLPVGMPEQGINPLQQDNDTASLPTAIKEWCRIMDEVKEFKQQIRERARRVKALENFILSIMKRNNIGALDLKSSGGRVLYKKSKRQATINPKSLNDILIDYMKGDQKAAEKAADIVKYISDKRETKILEKLAYESLDFDSE